MGFRCITCVQQPLSRAPCSSPGLKPTSLNAAPYLPVLPVPQVEAVDGLFLAAFQRPSDAILWALECNEAMIKQVRRLVLVVQPFPCLPAL